MSFGPVTGVSLGDAPVRELAALSGRALPLLRAWVREQPRLGVARALLLLATADDLTDQALTSELALAHEHARGSDARSASLVHAVFLHTHRRYRMTADHLITHFAAWPGDEVAALMIGAFTASDDPWHRACGDALIERHHELAGGDDWFWTSLAAWSAVERGRVERAHALARHALTLHPRSGVAAHALAHAEHESGAGPDAIAFLDRWLAQDPRAPQTRHLNWHAALQALACGDFAQARRRADEALDRADVGMRSATNWRLLLAGQSPAGRCDLDHVRALLAAPEGTAEVFHTFNLALALAVEAAGDDLDALAARAAADRRPEYRDVLAPVVRALAEITAGRPHAAVELLTSLGERVERLGGVRVEREIVQDTLARALVDCDEHARAVRLLNRRRTTRRHHAYEDHLLIPTGPAPTEPPTGPTSAAAAPRDIPAARAAPTERPHPAATAPAASPEHTRPHSSGPPRHPGDTS
ncbi:tetratricopeptide repeat protein [Embleya sp. NPDC001921]